MSRTPQPPPTASRNQIAPYLGPCFHPARSSGQADLYELTGPYAGWVLKDFSARPWLMRMLINRRALCREARALRALGELDGIPAFGGQVGSDALLIERLEADRLPHKKQGPPRLDTFDRMWRVLDAMHAAGWTHGDLRRKNILLDADEHPYLIDFATAWYGGPAAGPGARWVYRRLAHVDRVTLAGLKESYRPDDLTPAEHALLDQTPVHLRLGRWFKKNIYRPLKPRHRKETLRRILRLLTFRPR